MQTVTLCFPRRNSEVLLIEKRRGLGAGLYNGPGGKVEPDESPRECAIREVREEVGLDVIDLEKAGELTFVLDGSTHSRCHVFRTKSFTGDPEPSAEAHPEWFDIDNVPYDRMWADDRQWLPGVLRGKTVTATFEFTGGPPLDEATLVDSDVEWDVTFEGDSPSK